MPLRRDHRHIAQYGGHSSGAAAAPFTPTDVTGLYAWYQAESIVGADASAVSSWSDSGPNSLTLTQATGASQPTLRTNVVNSKQIVRFAGTDDSIVSDANFALSQPFTAFTVANPGTKSGTQHDAFFSGATHTISLNTTLTDGFLLMWGGSALSGAVDRSAAWHVFEGIWNGASSTGYTDGANDITTGDVGSGSLNAVKLQVGTNGFSFLAGDLAEIILYSGALSAPNRSSVRSYLGTKYNITVS